MLKRSGGLSKFKAQKHGKIDTEIFNFLENLLVFRTMDSLSVPAEGGVKFNITRSESGLGICLLIHIDNEKYPVFGEREKRPDYLSLYLYGNECICTVIEMKGSGEEDLRKGVKQIENLVDRLKAEFTEHLPPKLRFVMQGILLCSENANPPGKLIAEMEKSGLPIMVARYNNRAELYPYVSQRVSLKDQFRNESRSPSRKSRLEEMLSEGALRLRMKDPINNRRLTAKTRTGLHICFLLDEEAYAVLSITDNNCFIHVHEDGDQNTRLLKSEIEHNNLSRKIVVEKMPEV